MKKKQLPANFLHQGTKKLALSNDLCPWERFFFLLLLLFSADNEQNEESVLVLKFGLCGKWKMEEKIFNIDIG